MTPVSFLDDLVPPATRNQRVRRPLRWAMAKAEGVTGITGADGRRADAVPARARRGDLRRAWPLVRGSSEPWVSRNGGVPRRSSGSVVEQLQGRLHAPGEE